MSEAQGVAAPQPPELKETVFTQLASKSALPISTMVVLGIAAGAFISFGGIFAIVALSGSGAIPFGAGQVLAGLVFSLGLALVLVAGAELFTGNTMMLGALPSGAVEASKAAVALPVVWVANFAGSLLIAFAAYQSGLADAGEGAVRAAAYELASGKIGNGFATNFASGILANMLVCLAVWMAYAGKTVSAKLAGLVLPVAAFVAAGFEHSVANMFILPYGWLVQDAGGTIGWAGIAGNLVPSTLGNMVGGAAVALTYGFAYRNG